MLGGLQYLLDRGAPRDHAVGLYQPLVAFTVGFSVLASSVIETLWIGLPSEPYERLRDWRECTFRRTLRNDDGRASRSKRTPWEGAMKTLTGLLPIGIGVGLVAGLTWLLLDRNVGAARWLLAGLLLFHGWVHAMFLFPNPEPATASAGGAAWPFDLGQSWLIGNFGLDPDAVRSLGVVVIAVVVVAFALAALSTVGVIVPAAWWTGILVGSALASMLLLGLFFSPMLLLGFAIDLAVLWLALISEWSPQALARGIP